MPPCRQQPQIAPRHWRANARRDCAEKGVNSSCPTFFHHSPLTTHQLSIANLPRRRQQLGQLGAMRDDQEDGPFLLVQIQEKLRRLRGPCGDQDCRSARRRARPWATNQGPGDGHALAFAAGKLRRADVPADWTSPTRSSSSRAHGSAPLRSRVAGQRGDQHIFQHGALRQQIVILKDEADVPIAKIGQAPLSGSANGSRPSSFTVPVVG